jgi:YidC/Oxa1 family membrane protein insertase
MIPLTIKQQKFQKISSKMNPELMKINAKYKGKRDEVSMRKQQLETQAVYQKYGANPTSGCLPMLITLPILFALYQVIYRIPAYIPQIKDLYEAIAKSIMDNSDFATIMKDQFKSAVTAKSSLNTVIDALTKFDTSSWKELANAFPTSHDVIIRNSDKIMHINSFLGGLNIANSPASKIMPGVIIPILAVATQWYSTKQMQATTQTDPNAPGAAMMKSMTTFMPLFSGFICFTMPIGVGLYWVASAGFQILQQIIINRYFDKVDLDELVERSVEKAKKKKKRIDYSATLEELAKKQTKSIGEKTSNTTETSSETNTNTTSSTKNYAKVKTDIETQSTENSGNTNYKAGSIAEKANLLKGRNNSGKGDK